MSTPINELLDAAAKTTGSDYKTAKALGVTPQRLSDWRHDRRTATPEDHALIAAVAQRDPMEAMAKAMLAKHQGTEKGERLMSALGKGFRLSGALGMWLISASVGFFGSPRPATAAQSPAIDNV